VAEFHKEEECHNDQWKQGRKHKMTSQKNLATESMNWHGESVLLAPGHIEKYF
jgi:hypothetical protein